MGDNAAAPDELRLPKRFAYSVPSGEFAPYHARCRLDELIDGRASAWAAETARLLVSELVTNCVRHARLAPGGPIEVDGGFAGPALRTQVTSQGSPFEHPPRLPAATDPGGRGLYLVDTLAESWGVTASGSETSVWFEIPWRRDGGPLL
jgi:two-component sensor histidine kinase